MSALTKQSTRLVVPVRGEYSVELCLLNSHDRSSDYQLHRRLFRFICSKWLFVADEGLRPGELSSMPSCGPSQPRRLSRASATPPPAPIGAETLLAVRRPDVVADRQSVRNAIRAWPTSQLRP